MTIPTTAATMQAAIVAHARAANVTEESAQRRHGDPTEREIRAARIAERREAYERGARDLADHLRTGLFNARAVCDADRWIAALPPWCPSCGDPMTRQAAIPAEPEVGVAATPAHWECCGAVIRDDLPPLDPQDDADVRPDPFDQM